MIEKLKGSDVRREFDSGLFNFKTTAEIDTYTGIIGQNRAERALEFGLKIKAKGYNI